MLYRWFPSVLKAITIIRPETLVRWHRAGFRRYWRRKSRALGGRPKIDAELRALIRRMTRVGFPWACCTALFSDGWLFSQQVALSRVIRAQRKANVHLRGRPHAPLRSTHTGSLE
jgi:hypothetical protein